jgi:hypothetical protein
MRVFETNVTMKNRRDEIRLGRYLLEKGLETIDYDDEDVCNSACEKV